jgi:hypothetical protein
MVLFLRFMTIWLGRWLSGLVVHEYLLPYR